MCVTHFSHMLLLQWAGSYLSLASQGMAISERWMSTSPNYPRREEPSVTCSFSSCFCATEVTTGHLSYGYR